MSSNIFCLWSHGSRNKITTEPPSLTSLGRIISYPENLSVSSYLQHTLNFFTSSQDLNSESHDWIDQHKVLKLTIYKKKRRWIGNGNWKHGCVVADVAFPKLANPVQLCLFRTRAGGQVALTGVENNIMIKGSNTNANLDLFISRVRRLVDVAPDLPTSRPPIQTPIQPIPSFSSPSPPEQPEQSPHPHAYRQTRLQADDRVDVAPSKITDSYTPIDFFHPNDMSLLHLVQLAKTVHSLDIYYSFFAHQCYWFASLLYHAAEQRHAPASNPTSVTPYMSQEQVLVEVRSPSPTPVEKGKPHQSQSCTWKEIKVIDVQDILVSFVAEEYCLGMTTIFEMARKKREEFEGRVARAIEQKRARADYRVEEIRRETEEFEEARLKAEKTIEDLMRRIKELEAAQHPHSQA